VRARVCVCVGGVEEVGVVRMEVGFVKSVDSFRFLDSIFTRFFLLVTDVQNRISKGNLQQNSYMEYYGIEKCSR
jgi:hypothetical protein